MLVGAWRTDAATELGRQWECHAAFGLQDSGFFLRLSTLDSAMMGADRNSLLKRDPAMPGKKVAKQSPQKMKAVKAKLSKAEFFNLLSADSDVSTGDVKRVLGSLERLMEASIAKRGMGSFTLPGLMKITTLRRPAVKARKGINPFTGEETWFKAKPARTQVKIRPLKKLKGFAN